MNSSQDLGNTSNEVYTKKFIVIELVALTKEAQEKKVQIDNLIRQNINSRDYFEKVNVFIYGDSVAEGVANGEGVKFLEKLLERFLKFVEYHKGEVKTGKEDLTLLNFNLNYLELLTNAVSNLLNVTRTANQLSMCAHEEDMKAKGAPAQAQEEMKDIIRRVSTMNALIQRFSMEAFFQGAYSNSKNLDLGNPNPELLKPHKARIDQMKAAYDTAVNAFYLLKWKSEVFLYFIKNNHVKTVLEAAFQNKNVDSMTKALVDLFNTVADKHLNVAYYVLEQIAELNLQALKWEHNNNNNNNVGKDTLTQRYVKTLIETIRLKKDLLKDKSLLIKESSLQEEIREVTTEVAKLYKALFGRPVRESYLKLITEGFKTLLTYISSSDREHLDEETKEQIQKLERKEYGVMAADPQKILAATSKSSQQQQQLPITILHKNPVRDFKIDFERISKRANELLSDVMTKNNSDDYFANVDTWMVEGRAFIKEINEQLSLMPMHLKLDYWKYYTGIATQILKLTSKVSVEALLSYEEILKKKGDITRLAVQQIDGLQVEMNRIQAFRLSEPIEKGYEQLSTSGLFKDDAITSCRQVKENYDKVMVEFESLHWEVNILKDVVYNEEAKLVFKKMLQSSTVDKQIDVLADFYETLISRLAQNSAADLANRTRLAHLTYYILERIFKLHSTALIDVMNLPHKKRVDKSIVQVENVDELGYAKRLVQCIQHHEASFQAFKELSVRKAVFERQMNVILLKMKDWFIGPAFKTDNRVIDTQTFRAMTELFFLVYEKSLILLQTTNEQEKLQKFLKLKEQLVAEVQGFEDKHKQALSEKKEKEEHLEELQKKYVDNIAELLNQFEETKDENLRKSRKNQRKSILWDFNPSGETTDDSSEREEVSDSEDNNNNNGSVVATQSVERFPYTDIPNTTKDKLKKKLEESIQQKDQWSIAKCHMDLAEFNLKNAIPLSALPRDLSFISSNLGSGKKSIRINFIVGQLANGLKALIIVKTHLSECVGTINEMIGPQELLPKNNLQLFNALQPFLEGTSMVLDNANHLITEYVEYKTNFFRKIYDSHQQAIEKAGGYDEWKSNPKFESLSREERRKLLSPMALAFINALNFGDRFNKAIDEFNEIVSVHATLKTRAEKGQKPAKKSRPSQEQMQLQQKKREQQQQQQRELQQAQEVIKAIQVQCANFLFDTKANLLKQVERFHYDDFVLMRSQPQYAQYGACRYMEKILVPMVDYLKKVINKMENAKTLAKENSVSESIFSSAMYQDYVRVLLELCTQLTNSLDAFMQTYLSFELSVTDDEVGKINQCYMKCYSDLEANKAILEAFRDKHQTVIHSADPVALPSTRLPRSHSYLSFFGESQKEDCNESDAFRRTREM